MGIFKKKPKPQDNRSSALQVSDCLSDDMRRFIEKLQLAQNGDCVVMPDCLRTVVITSTERVDFPAVFSPCDDIQT